MNEQHSLLEKAQAYGFDEFVLDTIKECGLQVEDLPMTEREIKEEFSQLNFGVRRRLSKFFKTLTESEQLGSELFSDIVRDDSFDESFNSHSSDSTMPAVDEHGNLNRKDEEYVPTGKKRKKHFEQFCIVSDKAELDSTREISYPNGIPYPFPIEKTYSVYLDKVTKLDFAKNYSAYCAVVRNIYEVIHFRIGKPTQEDRNKIAAGLVKEYPVLAGGDPSTPYSALSTSIRKRANNYAQFVKGVVQPAGSTGTGSSSKENAIPVAVGVDDPHCDEDLVKYLETHSIREFFEKYKEFEDYNKCIEAFSTKTKQWEIPQWQRRWDRLLNNYKTNLELVLDGDGDKSHDFEIFYNLVNEICTNKDTAKLIITFSEVGDVSSMKSNNQPYLLVTGSPTYTSDVVVVVEKQKILSLTNVSMFNCFISLVAVYYLLNLEYPHACKNVYKSLVDYIIFDEPIRFRKLASVFKAN